MMKVDLWSSCSDRLEGFQHLGRHASTCIQFSFFASEHFDTANLKSKDILPFLLEKSRKQLEAHKIPTTRSEHPF